MSSGNDFPELPGAGLPTGVPSLLQRNQLDILAIFGDFVGLANLGAELLTQPIKLYNQEGLEEFVGAGGTFGGGEGTDWWWGQFREDYEEAFGTFAEDLLRERLSARIPVRIWEPESALDAIPQYTWVRPYGGPPETTMLSLHTDQMRWVRVVAFVLRDQGEVEVPLLDADNRPFLNASALPPKIMVRRHESNTDRVSNPRATSIRWTDQNAAGRQNSGTWSASTETGSRATLKLKLDPVPHWVVKIKAFKAAETTNKTNILVDLVGTGYGPHSSATVEVGSAGTVGHHKTELMWSQQSFNAASDRAALNERTMGHGSIYVPNVIPASASTLYLTTGGVDVQGQSTGTALFSNLPMVMVLGDQVLATDRTAAAETTWMPESWGMGIAGPAAASGSPSTARDKAYRSEVYLDSVSGHYAVDIINDAGATGASNSALDRTFYVFSLGE